MNCRHCSASLEHTFLDLGYAPPSNAYLTEADLSRPEKYYPLKVKVCDHCWLVQTEDYAQADELFSPDYAYFSSTSSSWLAHAASYAQNIIQRLNLNQNSYVIEVASNDGYLLKNFVAARIPCLGIEPTDSTAETAENLGIPVLRKFFGKILGEQLAINGQQADLIVGNNVYAHVPDINDFTLGLKLALKPNGTITLEFPHVMSLLEQNQFDTIYHEHFSYLSLYTVERIFRAAGLRICDVERLPTHGGSLRIYGCHVVDIRPNTEAVHAILAEEKQYGLQTIATYQNCQVRANKLKNDLIKFLIDQACAGKKVVAYGAAAKGNTLLNYAGIKTDLISVVYDASPAKQGKYMPGSHIPILSSAILKNTIPDYLLILPWNIGDEIKKDNSELVNAGVKFITAIPKLSEL